MANFIKIALIASGPVLISRESEGLDIKQVQDEFRLEPLGDYFKRAADARNRRLKR